MVEPTDDHLLAAVTKLRAARTAEAEAFKACDTAERAWRECLRAHDDARSNVSAAVREVDRLRITSEHFGEAA